jgi:dTDP-4-dehydrorhamnose 3,5-epimerase-like enzyme
MNSIADNSNTRAVATGRSESKAAERRCKLFDLPIVSDSRGNLTFIESDRHVPFKIKRVFYLYDVPGGAERAGHALKTCSQFIIAVNGSFGVTIDDGSQKFSFQLNRSYHGLYIPPMMWREIDNFSSGSVCMILASEFYDEDDYFRDYEEFLCGLREEKD